MCAARVKFPRTGLRESRDALLDVRFVCHLSRSIPNMVSVRLRGPAMNYSRAPGRLHVQISTPHA